MKPGRIILAIVFFVLFIICFYLLVNGWRSYDYEAVFPEDVNIVIQLHRPTEVPLKVLNSSAASKFFDTEKGRQMLDTLNTTLSAAGAGGGGGGAAPPVLYKENVEGVTVYYIGGPLGEGKGSTKAGKGQAPDLDLEQLKKGMAIGGTVVKNVYLAMYGNPAGMMNQMGGEGMPTPNFMAAVDLGRLTAVPRAVLPGKAKPVDELPEGEKLKAGFAFIRNMAVMGDPDGVKRMIHVAHGTSMKDEVTEMNMETGEEVTKTVELNTTPLGKSGRWVESQKAWEAEEPDFRLTLLAPNLLDKLQSDPMMKEMLEGKVEKYGLDRLQALVLSSESGKKGLTLRMSLLSEKGNPLLEMLDGPEKEMEWPGLLPGDFLSGVGANFENYSKLYADLKGIGGGDSDDDSPIATLGDSISKIFGIDGPTAFLDKLAGEVSLIRFHSGTSSHNVYCFEVTSGIEGWFEQVENEVAQREITGAQDAIDLAEAGGAAEFAPGAVMTAVEALEDARANLEAANNANAVALARKASRLAKEAMKTRYKEAKAAIDEAATQDAYTYVYDLQMEAENTLKKASDAYEAGNPVRGRKLSEKAMAMGRCSLYFSRTSSMIQNAENKKAASKAPKDFNAAKDALKKAEASMEEGDYSAASTQAQLAFSLAEKAFTQVTGSEPSEPGEVTIEVEKPDTTLPEVESPRVVNGAEVYTTVGTMGMDYTLMDNTVCMAKPDGLEAYLGTERGNVIKQKKINALFENIPRETQALSIANIYAALEAQGMTMTLDEEMKEFVSGLNLSAGSYLITSPTKVVQATTLPVKLFDGSTGGGARTVTVLVIWILKILLYVFTALFLYLTVKLLIPGKKKAK